MSEDLAGAGNIHPGKYLKKELDDRGWMQTDLQFILGCSANTVNQIIAGKRGISPEMSKALGEALSVPQDHFADLQKTYDLACANEPDPTVSLRAKLQSTYPLRDMIKRGWIKDGDGSDLANQLAIFFEVERSEDIPHIEHAAKKTNYTMSETSAIQMAWLFRVRQLAKSITVPSYSRKALQEALVRLRNLITEPEEARHVPRILSECGVRFIIVESLPQAKIDGVCMWLDDNAPVIGLSARFDRIDNFWFVLRHEIEHVLQGHGKGASVHVDVLDGELAGVDVTLPKEEIIANTAAADFGVAILKMDSFMARKDPFYYEKDVLAFAKVQATHPGIVVGQIQHRLGRYDYLKKYQVKIRQFVLPGAIVDGWGQTGAF